MDPQYRVKAYEIFKYLKRLVSGICRRVYLDPKSTGMSVLVLPYSKLSG